MSALIVDANKGLVKGVIIGATTMAIVWAILASSHQSQPETKLGQAQSGHSRLSHSVHKGVGHNGTKKRPDIVQLGGTQSHRSGHSHSIQNDGRHSGCYADGLQYTTAVGFPRLDPNCSKSQDYNLRIAQRMSRWGSEKYVRMHGLWQVAVNDKLLGKPAPLLTSSLLSNFT